MTAVLCVHNVPAVECCTVRGRGQCRLCGCPAATHLHLTRPRRLGPDRDAREDCERCGPEICPSYLPAPGPAVRVAEVLYSVWRRLIGGWG